MTDIIRTLSLKMLEELSHSDLTILLCEKYLLEAYELGRGKR